MEIPVKKGRPVSWGRNRGLLWVELFLLTGYPELYRGVVSRLPGLSHSSSRSSRDLRGRYNSQQDHACSAW